VSPRVPGEGWYRRLLALYPAAFRVRYGEEMAAFYRERWLEARSRGRLAAAALWASVVADLAATALAERAEELTRRAKAAGAARAAALTFDDRREGEMLSSIWQDVRYALRGLARRPGFAVVVVATLTLGIGANAAIFSVVNGVLLRPLPFAAPERLVQLDQQDPYWTVSEPEFMDYRRDARVFERVAAYTGSDVSLTGSDEPERVEAARVSDQFFSTLGVAAARGRTFSRDEEGPGSGPSPVIVISDGLWRRRFGADPGIVGRSVIVNNVPRTVVGVMPPHLDFPSPKTSVWVPLRLDPDSLWTRNNHYLTVIARLTPGATAEQASVQLNTLTRRWMRDFPETYFPDKPLAVAVVPMRDAILGPTRPYLVALLGAVGFVLLIACVNVANLLLARGESRRKELAIRTALGASGRRLARQALTESALLAGVGGALGLVVAWVGGRALVAMAPSTVPRLDQVAIDARVLAFTAAVALATGLLFGLAPALRAARGVSAETLKQGGKTSGGGGTHRTRRALVVTEVALAVVMLAGAGLMLRSLGRLRAMELGFDQTRLLTMRLSLPVAQYDDARAAEYYRELVARAAALPGVRGAAAVRQLPMEREGDDGWSIAVDGRNPKTIAEAPVATPAQVTPDYFQVMRIPLLRGRGFTAADRADAPPVAVVNETMAKQLWPGADPVGRTLRMFSDQSPWVTVVGVVKDVRSNGFLADVPAVMYFPHAQTAKSAYVTPRSMALVVRAAGDPMALAGALRRTVRTLDPNVPISSVQSMEQVVAGRIASRRFATALLGTFAALALALAGVGIYGVIAFGVSQRTYELGLRMVLGAQRHAVLRLVVSEALGMTLVGLALGLGGALAVGYMARSLLVGVPVADVPTLALVSAVLAGVAVLASALPARRATLVSPTEALRNG
jgi:putative ABC transport system permease protein